jgi:hypothetical protein
MYKFLILLLAGSPLVWAQFGGRDGDVVLYLVSAKGKQDFQAVSPSVTNTGGGFEVKDPFDQPMEPFGPDFPSESRRLLHAEVENNFMLIVQKENIMSPHQQAQDYAKVLIIHGMLRLFPGDKPPIDAAAGFFAPFPATVDFGPNEALFEEWVLLWTPAPFFPVVRKVDPDYASPVDPPGLTGVEYVYSLGTFTPLAPWKSLANRYPGDGWQDGIDLKLVEEDTNLGTTIQFLRMRPGRKTPPFRIPANTHLTVLSGSVELTPLNGITWVMKPFQYAFLPNSYAITLANPKQYNGPLGIR